MQAFAKREGCAFYVKIKILLDLQVFLRVVEKTWRYKKLGL